ncbi:MAG: DUF1573 domain-containing protein [Aureispira sp.]
MKPILLLFCLLFIHQATAQRLELEAHAITEEKPYVEINFEGKQPKKGYKTQLTLLNTASTPLLITEVEGGCSCIKVRIKKKKLKQHQKTILHIHWNPPGETEFSGAIRLDSNDPKHPELWIHLMGSLEG